MNEGIKLTNGSRMIDRTNINATSIQIFLAVRCEFHFHWTFRCSLNICSEMYAQTLWGMSPSMVLDDMGLNVLFGDRGVVSCGLSGTCWREFSAPSRLSSKPCPDTLSVTRGRSSGFLEHWYQHVLEISCDVEGKIHLSQETNWHTTQKITFILTTLRIISTKRCWANLISVGIGHV